MNSKNTWAQPLQLLWAQSTQRERLGLRWAAGLLVMMVFWQWGIAPALKVWSQAPERQVQLMATTQRMLNLQEQARQLKGHVRTDRTQALKWIEDHRDELGPEVQFVVQDGMARLQLKAVSAAALAQWLVQAREKAQSVAEQADLRQAPASKNDTQVIWQGTLTLRLP